MARKLRQIPEKQLFVSHSCHPDRTIRWVTAKNRDLRVCFDRSLKLKFLGREVITDTGLLVYRKLDGVLGLTEMGEEAVEDGPEQAADLLPWLRQSIYSRLPGHEDVN